MSDIASSDELCPLLVESLDDVLRSRAHDTLVSLLRGHEELLVKLEASSLSSQSVPWLDREHREWRSALIRLMGVGVLFSCIP